MNNPKQHIFEVNFSKALPASFYLNNPAFVAEQLIGKVFVSYQNGEYLAARITETEAYLSVNDEASHSAKGKTLRNAPMFAKGGILYVYFIYGMHYCFNIVCENEGIGSAVLIRAMEPLLGIKTMSKRRNKIKLIDLCNGPAKAAQAFAFNKNNNYENLNTESLFVQDDNFKPNVISTTRIGIKKSMELNLRFFNNDSDCISIKPSNKQSLKEK